MNELNIYQRINAVMSECEYLQKKGAAQGNGIKYDEVIAMIRELLIKHGIVMVVRQTSFESIKDQGKQTIYQGCYEMDLINMDNPTDRVTHTAYAQGMDGGDKAAGKAHTYAVKIMLVKGFGIETGDDEESRAEKIEKTKTIDISSQNSLAKAIGGDPVLWANLCKAYNITELSQILISKEKEITQRIMSYREAKRNANNT
jgi:hypothetical protein